MGCGGYSMEDECNEDALNLGRDDGVNCTWQTEYCSCYATDTNPANFSYQCPCTFFNDPAVCNDNTDHDQFGQPLGTPCLWEPESCGCYPEDYRTTGIMLDIVADVISGVVADTHNGPTFPDQCAQNNQTGITCSDYHNNKTACNAVYCSYIDFLCFCGSRLLYPDWPLVEEYVCSMDCNCTDCSLVNSEKDSSEESSSEDAIRANYQLSDDLDLNNGHVASGNECDCDFVLSLSQDVIIHVWLILGLYFIGTWLCCHIWRKRDIDVLPK